MSFSSTLTFPFSYLYNCQHRFAINIALTLSSSTSPTKDHFKSKTWRIALIFILLHHPLTHSPLAMSINPERQKNMDLCECAERRSTSKIDRLPSSPSR